MRATITQIDASQLHRNWEELREHVSRERSDLVLLPEMCFAPWFCTAPEYDESVWRAAVNRLTSAGLSACQNSAT